MPQVPSAQWAALPDHPTEVRRLHEEFVQRYGTEPDGVWSAPGRLNLLGEYVDFNGGSCMPTALPYRTLVAGKLRRDGIVHAESLQIPGHQEMPLAEVAPGTVSGWFSYVGGVAWAMDREGREDMALPPEFGADLLINSTVPVGGGLSSSAALLSAVALAFLELSCPLRSESALAPLPVGGCGPDNDSLRRALAHACMVAENEIAGAHTGNLDHTAALRSLPGNALYIDFRDLGIQPLTVVPEDDGLTFLVIDTNAPHDLADGQFSQRRQACEEATRAAGVRYLRDLLPEELGFPELGPQEAARARVQTVEQAVEHLVAQPEVVQAVGEETVRTWIRHVFTDMALVERARTLFTDRRPVTEQTWEELGALFTVSHASMRDDLQASREELDVAVRTCLDLGALGARLVGGGFGGAVLALVPEGTETAVAQGVSEAFAARGFAAPTFLPLGPGRPANRDL